MQILREVSALHWNRVCLALYIPSRYGPSALSCFGGARALSGAGSAFVCTARPVKPRGPNARVLSAGHRFALVLSGVLSSGRPASGLAVARWLQDDLASIQHWVASLLAYAILSSFTLPRQPATTISAATATAPASSLSPVAPTSDLPRWCSPV